MRMDSDLERRRFWTAFDKKLIENGEPFFIVHEKGGKVTFWAAVNKKHALVDNALSIDFLVRERKVRLNIYVRDNLPLFRIFENHKSEIESMISVPVKWVGGVQNPNTRRIIYEVPVDIGYFSNYEDVIDEILPTLVEMKKVCERYAKDEFFDF